jgi:hypothetical protein
MSLSDAHRSISLPQDLDQGALNHAITEPLGLRTLRD